MYEHNGFLFERIDELGGFGILELVFFFVTCRLRYIVKKSFDVFKNIEEKTPSRGCRWQKEGSFGYVRVRFFE